MYMCVYVSFHGCSDSALTTNLLDVPLLIFDSFYIVLHPPSLNPLGIRLSPSPGFMQEYVLAKTGERSPTFGISQRNW